MPARIVEVQMDTGIVTVSNESGELFRLSKGDYERLNLRYQGMYGSFWYLFGKSSIKYFDFLDDIWRIERR